jgi:hypothetical protein
MPGAMIISETTSVYGFDPNSESDSLSATVNPLGNVTLTWTPPSSMDVNDNYLIYRASQRTGFHDGSATLEATVSFGTQFWIDPYVAVADTQYYCSENL